MRGPAPELQDHWDWRAAGNFIGGGTGSGLLAICGLAAWDGIAVAPFVLLALIFIGVGLGLVWLEIGRPLRALHVFFHPQTSWMTREAIVAAPLFATALAGVFLGWRLGIALAAMIALVFLYCQARILQASTGVPAWRHPLIVPLIIATGLSEGTALLVLLVLNLGILPSWLAGLLFLFLLARILAWSAYRQKLLTDGAPSATLAVLAKMSTPFILVGNVAPIGLLMLSGLVPAALPISTPLAASLALVGGWFVKFGIVRWAAQNQGFALPRMPSRGPRGSSAGTKPGWN